MATIVGISGSLRRGSYNAALLRAAAELAPPGLAIEVASIREFPLYDGDLEAEQGIPEPVRAVNDRIAVADGLLLVTPEYNNSIPGVFKNAIDWLSRPPKDIPRVFGGRPVALMGATPGPGGTILAQAAWLPVLRTLGMELWPGPRVYVSRADKAFDASGRLVDEAVRALGHELRQGLSCCHRAGRTPRPAVARQHPFESVREQPLHGSCLLAPVIPADAAAAAETTFRVPPQVVTGEEESLAVEQRGRARSVAGDGDDEEVVRERDRRVAFDLPLHISRAAADVARVQHALAAEGRCPARVIGDVVAVGEEHEARAAQLADPGQERNGEAGRVDEHVSARPRHEPARGSERGLGRVAAVVHAAFLGDRLREGLGCRRRSGGVLHDRPDSPHRAGDQRHERPPLFLRCGRLPSHEGGVVLAASEDAGRDAPAGVAGDAGSVHEEVTWYVLRGAIDEAGHGGAITERQARFRAPPR
jgi:NAD(P)H-dependent FMN reductase